MPARRKCGRCVRRDPCVGHGAHVGAGPPRRRWRFVDERDLRGQERIGGVLDHLGGGTLVRRRSFRCRRRAVGSRRRRARGRRDHDTVRVQHVVDRGALAQELGWRRSRSPSRRRSRARPGRARRCHRHVLFMTSSRSPPRALTSLTTRSTRDRSASPDGDGGVSTAMNSTRERSQSSS